MNIFDDITKDIDIKPTKSKLVVKWIIRISALLIGFAFIAGQIKINSINRINSIEKSVTVNSSAIIELKDNLNVEFNHVNKRINKIYDDGYKALNEYEKHNNKQLELIIDYNESNKDLLKKIINVNTIENNRDIAFKLDKLKNLSIINNKLKNIGIEGIDFKTNSFIIDKNDTIFIVNGVLFEYIDEINQDLYEILDIKKSEYPNLYNVKFKNINKN